MTLFDQYGIKEVADVTLYSIHRKEDGSGNLYYVPALYLDTLKVSTTEKTAENTWAEGGIGNSRLINWDFGKTINVNLEDALCTPASLGLCWNGILSAGWKNGKIEFNSETNNSITKLSRMEKARATKYGPQKGTVGNLLPKIKADIIDDDFSLLKISSIVDGTNIRGFGCVNNHNYKWKMAIESAVKSIAVVPDRFFDINGKTYPIDWDRKVSVHSLPDYENYKDAIIYKINNRGKFAVPPLAKIIYDSAIEGQGQQVELNFYYEEEITEETLKPSYSTLGQLLKVASGKENNPMDDTPAQYRFRVYEDNLFEAGNYELINDKETFISSDNFYFSLRGLSAEIFPLIGYKTTNINSENIILADELWKINSKGFAVENDININNKEDGIYYSIGSKKWFQKENGIISELATNIPEYCITDIKINEAIENVTIINLNQAVYVYDINEQCFKINNDSSIYTQIKGNTLKELEEDIGASLARYLWNHPVDVIKNDTGKEYIDQTEYTRPIEKCDYLAIIIDNNNNYIPLVGVAINLEDSNDIGLSISQNFNSSEPENKKTVIWFNPCPMVDTSQFKGLDMWIRFQSINEMIYFLITKYEDDIISIKAATIESPENQTINKYTTTVKPNADLEAERTEGKLWAYINPRTMTPYDDDYWFHYGEPYYIKSLTLAPNNKKISGKRITISADQWPGMYMMVGESWIRSRDTGEDMRLQIKIPLCKVRSDHTLTLEAEGEPTTFNLTLEVAQPQSGEIMEITAYEVRTKMVEGENGEFYAVDGSSEVVIE